MKMRKSPDTVDPEKPEDVFNADPGFPIDLVVETAQLIGKLGKGGIFFGEISINNPVYMPLLSISIF